jgi:GT2 family glycosyltransferase
LDVSVHIFDNASSDGTAELIREMSLGDVTTFSEENIFYGPAVNQLVRSSDAEYVLLLNPDTEVPPSLLDDLVGVLRDHPDVAIAFPSLTDGQGVFQNSSYPFPTVEFELAQEIRGTKVASSLGWLWNADEVVQKFRGEPPADRPFAMNLVWSACTMMRRVEAEHYGPFRQEYPMYDTDLDLCRRLSASGRMAYWVSSSEVMHVGGASSSTESKQVMMHSARANYYREYGGRLSAATYTASTTALPRLKALSKRLRSIR